MGPRVSETGALTGAALALIAILAILTVLAILWGARLKHRRAEADRIERERGDEEGDPATADRPLVDSDATDRPATPAASPTPSPSSAPSPPPIAPAPPPLADTPVVATPSPPEPRVDAAPDAGPLADEPVAAAAPLDASPAAEAQPAVEPEPDPAPAGPPPGEAPVTQIKGLGPKVAARLAEAGVTTVGQLAALDQRAAEDLDARLGPFTGRMARDRWLEQARLLARGDVAGFEEKFGRV